MHGASSGIRPVTVGAAPLHPPVRSGWANSSGDRIRFEDGGRGPAVLLIAGLGLSVRSLDPVALLREHHRVIALEPRGSGESPLGNRPLAGPELAADVAAVLDACGEPHAHVVGVSMGGMIAQQAAVHAEARVRSLTLIATHAFASEWTRRVFAIRGMLLEKIGMAAQVELGCLMLSSPGTFARHQALVDGLRQHYADAPPDATSFAEQMRFCVEHDARDALARVQVPGLVIAGMEDLLIPPDSSRELAERLPQARYLELPDASHLLLFEARARLVDEIESFIADVEATPSALGAHA